MNNLEGHSRSSLFDEPHHFLLMVCSNNVSTLHRFRTFTVQVNSYDLEMSFSFARKDS